MARESNEKLGRLASGRILPLMMHYALPALVTMTLHMLYNVIDRIYIGQGCGQDAIAGLALTTPVMMALGAFGVLIGVGSSALLSIRLGEEKMADAERILGQCVALKLLLGVTIAPALFFTLPAILRFMAGEGATATTVGYARQYLSIILFFNVLSHLAFGLSACMRAEGSPRQAMMCMVVGFSTNLILDPVFIFWFKMGVAGAAWATNIAMLLSLAWALAYYLGPNSVVKLHVRKIRIYGDLCLKALAIGLSPFLMQLVGSLINFSMNHAFAVWAPSDQEGTANIAAFGIFQAATMLFLMPAFGVQQGAGPVIGYNWGAKNYARVRETLVYSLALTTAACVFATLGQDIFAWALSRCFAKDASLVGLGAYGIRLGNCCIWVIGVNVAATTYFQSIGHPRTAILLSLLRQLICLLPCVWLLPHLFPGHPVFGVWIAMPISDVLAFLATIIPLAREFRRLGSGMPEAKLP